MDYEWDEGKNALNVEKHGADFALMDLFDWSSVRVFPDNRHSEPRYLAYGFIGDRLYVCTHTWRDDICRIISLRKANDRERRKYNGRS